jgi:glycosyltransferase involved in cell wall biosynthesis
MRRGNPVQVLCCGTWTRGTDHWNGYDDGTYKGISVRRINLNWTKVSNPAEHLYNNPIIRKHVDQFLDEVSPDLVHVTSCETLSASVLQAVKNKKIPLVLSITDFWFLCPRISLLNSDGKNCDGIKSPWECQKCLAKHTKIYRLARSVLPSKGLELFLMASGRMPFMARRRGFRGHIRNMSGRKKFLRSMFSLPDVRLTASAFVRNMHVKNGFNDPIRIHPYGHDLSWLRKGFKKEKRRMIRLGFIGQIIRSKGVHLILDAINLLDDSLRKKIRLSIYGNIKQNPGYGASIQEKINALENVIFKGTYPHDETAKVFSDIDVLVVPSLWYDFPLIVYEAFATKTPVIASRLGGLEEAISHGVDGLLFERGNVLDLAAQINRLINEPPLLEKLASKLPAVKTIEQEGAELMKIYGDLT